VCFDVKQTNRFFLQQHTLRTTTAAQPPHTGLSRLELAATKVKWSPKDIYCNIVSYAYHVIYTFLTKYTLCVDARIHDTSAQARYIYIFIKYLLDSVVLK
jgi:hypothetical protein